jgi:hypothetical protein
MNSRCNIPSSSKNATNMTLMLDFVARDFLGRGDELGQKQHSDCATPPSHSPDLAPSDFWLFHTLKMGLRGRRFVTVEDIKENAEARLSDRN